MTGDERSSCRRRRRRRRASFHSIFQPQRGVAAPVAGNKHISVAWNRRRRRRRRQCRCTFDKSFRPVCAAENVCCYTVNRFLLTLVE